MSMSRNSLRKIAVRCTPLPSRVPKGPPQRKENFVDHTHRTHVTAAHTRTTATRFEQLKRRRLDTTKRVYLTPPLWTWILREHTYIRSLVPRVVEDKTGLTQRNQENKSTRLYAGFHPQTPHAGPFIPVTRVRIDALYTSVSLVRV